MVQQRDLVFISYSHTDRDWLARLLVFLKPFTGSHFRVWADPYIKIGDEWRRDISGAVSRARVAVLLVSPDFLASDFIRNEELPPLLEGAKVGTITLFPIAISASSYRATALTHYQFAHPPERPLDRMPRPRRHAALVQISEKIVEAAQTATPDVRAAPAPVAERSGTAIASADRAAMLHGVPGQRPNYLRRQEYLDRLKEAVLGAEDRVVGITGTTPQGPRIGLHGMGGIGKTVLTIDLVNDAEVRRAFPDGIFWLTLGQTIEPLQLQGELAGYMTGETKASATVGEARDQLRQLFDGKSCLLVLDDLWRPQDADPFDVLSPRSRLLVTTRDADLLVALGARELALNVLSEELALELLASWSGQPRTALPATARNVAASCGYLPLALALAGARVQGGARWEEVQSALQRGRLEFLDHPYGSVFSSLRLSIDALSAPERDRYFELAVFPEDANIPVAAICTLWCHTGRIKPDVSRDLLRRLHRRALLTLHDEGSGVSFHDLQHDFLRLNIASLVGGHAALVEAYRATAPSGWAGGSHDGYFFQHLPQHLAAADRLDELKALLLDYDWLAAKLRATDITALLADYDLAATVPDFALIQQALRLSIPAIVGDRLQLPSQLLGRLKGMGGRSIKALLRGAERGPGRAWLSPRFQSLTPAGGPVRQILVGHRGPVNAVAFLAAGRRALSASSDRTLRLWDLTTGETLRTFEGHTGQVNAVAVLPDGNRALSSSHDTTLRLWDLTTGDTLRLIRGHYSSVRAVSVLADGHRALSGANDNTLRLWDLATGKTLGILQGHTSGVIAVAVLAGGRHALSGSYDNTLRLWDLSSGGCLRTLDGHYSFVTSLAGLAEGRLALSGSSDETLRLWDLTTGDTLRTLEGHTHSVNALAVSADGSRVLSGSADHTLRLWDLATGETLRILEGHIGSVNAVAMLPDGRGAISGSKDNTLRLWDLDATEASARSAQSIIKDNTLRLWDLDAGSVPGARNAHGLGISTLVVLAGGAGALSGSADGSLRLWDLATGQAVPILEGHTGRVNTLAVLADGRRVLTGANDNSVRLWDLHTGETLRTLYGHTNPVWAVAVSADGSCALSGSSDNTVRLWDLASGENLRILTGHTDRVSAVAVLADGSRALSGSWDNTLRLWDLATGEILLTFKGHAGPIRAVAVLADGGHALSGAYDGKLRLWDLATGKTLSTFEGHTRAVRAAAVSPDGGRAISASADNTLRLWDLATVDCLAIYTADAPIECAAFARDDLVVAGSADGKIHILEIRER